MHHLWTSLCGQGWSTMVDQFGSDVCVRGGQIVWLEWGKSRLRKEAGRIFIRSQKGRQGKSTVSGKSWLPLPTVLVWVLLWSRYIAQRKAAIPETQVLITPSVFLMKEQSLAWGTDQMKGQARGKVKRSTPSGNYITNLLQGVKRQPGCLTSWLKMLFS